MEKIYKKIIIGLLILVPFFYYFVLIPLYNRCKETGGTKMTCLQYLIRF